MKKLNTKEIQNRLADLNEQRQRIENIKTYLLCVVLGFSVLSCYIGEPMFCALVFIVMPAYVTVHIFLNTKIELILWKLMYISCGISIRYVLLSKSLFNINRVVTVNSVATLMYSLSKSQFSQHHIINSANITPRRY